MLLTALFLDDVGDVNTFTPVTQLEIGAGDTQDIYFQIVDIAVNPSAAGFNPPGRRYMTAVNSTVAIELLSVDCNKQIFRQAVMPFSQDASIWKFTVLASDPIGGTVMMKIKITEPTRTLSVNGGKGIMLRIR
jgi:hypothetical protein